MSFDRLRAELEGSLVGLEPLDERHLDGLLAAARDPAIWRWLLLPGAPPTPETLVGWFERSLAESAAGRECAFATIWQATGRVIGSRSVEPPVAWVRSVDPSANVAAPESVGAAADAACSKTSISSQPSPDDLIASRKRSLRGANL